MYLKHTTPSIVSGSSTFPSAPIPTSFPCLHAPRLAPNLIPISIAKSWVKLSSLLMGQRNPWLDRSFCTEEGGWKPGFLRCAQASPNKNSRRECSVSCWQWQQPCSAVPYGIHNLAPLMLLIWRHQALITHWVLKRQNPSPGASYLVVFCCLNSWSG